MKLTLNMPSDAPSDEVAVIRASLRSEEGVRAPLQALLTRKPEWVDRIGAVARAAEDTILATLGSQVVIQEGARAELRAKCKSLELPNDGDLERLLINRVGLSWLALSQADSVRASLTAQGLSHEKADFWDRHVSRLNGDFLKACKALATVRKLRLPSVQVNIAGQQLNVLGESRGREQP